MNPCVFTKNPTQTRFRKAPRSTCQLGRSGAQGQNGGEWRGFIERHRWPGMIHGHPGHNDPWDEPPCVPRVFTGWTKQKISVNTLGKHGWRSREISLSEMMRYQPMGIVTNIYQPMVLLCQKLMINYRIFFEMLIFTPWNPMDFLSVTPMDDSEKWCVLKLDSNYPLKCLEIPQGCSAIANEWTAFTIKLVAIDMLHQYIHTYILYIMHIDR